MLTKFEIERIIPKHVSDSTFDFSKPRLDHESIDDIAAEFEIGKTTDTKQFNSGIFVQVAIQALNNMDTSTLGKVDQKKHSELKYLLQRIGNIKVNEADLLAELMEIV